MDLLQASDWSCSVQHVFREANACADMLADLGHHGGFHWTVLDTTPSHIRLALEADARGCVSSRPVPNV